ncbi:hypothetical protein C8F01DRAFT_1236791 [Mycena amicta]|nr:hypothetical protein C8F01DRAFT_1236791 [Mycena amicta]
MGLAECRGSRVMGNGAVEEASSAGDVCSELAKAEKVGEASETSPRRVRRVEWESETLSEKQGSFFQKKWKPGGGPTTLGGGGTRTRKRTRLWVIASRVRVQSKQMLLTQWWCWSADLSSVQIFDVLCWFKFPWNAVDREEAHADGNALIDAVGATQWGSGLLAMCIESSQKSTKVQGLWTHHGVVAAQLGSSLTLVMCLSPARDKPKTEAFGRHSVLQLRIFELPTFCIFQLPLALPEPPVANSAAGLYKAFQGWNENHWHFDSKCVSYMFQQLFVLVAFKNQSERRTGDGHLFPAHRGVELGRRQGDRKREGKIRTLASDGAAILRGDKANANKGRKGGEETFPYAKAANDNIWRGASQYRPAHAPNTVLVLELTLADAGLSAVQFRYLMSFSVFTRLGGYPTLSRECRVHARAYGNTLIDAVGAAQWGSGLLSTISATRAAGRKFAGVSAAGLYKTFRGWNENHWHFDGEHAAQESHQAPYPQHRLPDLDKCEAIVPSDVLPVYIHDNRADGRGGASHLFVLVAFKNRSSESASEARVDGHRFPAQRGGELGRRQGDRKSTTVAERNVRVSVEAWATSWGKTFGSEHGASGDNLKGNEGRKASEDGELHLVDNVETEY